MEYSPEVAELADESKRKQRQRPRHWRLGVQWVVDEKGNVGAIQPIVAAVPEEVKDGHGSMTIPAEKRCTARRQRCLKAASYQKCQAQELAVRTCARRAFLEFA